MIVGTSPGDNMIQSLVWWIARKFTRKESMFWHWGPFPNKPPFTILIPGDPNAKLRKGWWQGIWQTNFGWKKVVVLEPMIDKDTPYPKAYRIGFISDMEQRQQVCAVLLKGRCACLIGPHATKFFAVVMNTQFLQLRVVPDSATTKQELDRSITLI